IVCCRPAQIRAIVCSRIGSSSCRPGGYQTSEDGSVVLSASINLFDGHELLAPLVASLRDQVAHLSVVYQTVSFWGNAAADTLWSSIEALVRDGRIDDVRHYDGSARLGWSAKEQEAEKRTLGLELARNAGATHYLSLDVDEFYRPDELRRAA